MISKITLVLGISLLSLADVFGQNRPNIIYIYADDLGYGELGAYGQKIIKTPNLDRMAKEGMLFTQHYTSTPVCAPARAMLLTGRHGGHSYIRGNYEMGGFSDRDEGGQMPLPEGTFTIARMLKDKGYRTGVIGKWGLGMHFTSGDPNKQGFDYAYGYLDQKQAHNYYPTHLWENGKRDILKNKETFIHVQLSEAEATDANFKRFEGNENAVDKMTEKAVSFIKSNNSEPFFLYLPYTLPHVALQAPDRWIAYYNSYFENEKPYLGGQGYNPQKYPLATYAAMISYLDEQVGIILSNIKELGLDDNTIIMFSSDNGPTFNGGVNAELFNSTGGLRGLKMDVYEGGIRVPFIARWPKHIPADTKSDLPSAQYDLMATLAELTGAKVPTTDGISFLPTLMGQSKNQSVREFIFFEYPEKGGQLAIRLGDWKGVKTDVKANPKANWSLFDLKLDPKEQNDVALEHPEVLRKLDEIVRNEHQNAHIREWEFLNSKMPVHK
ncbi:MULTISPECIES: arylsulfatase [Sphingobacterium]|uniref:arylsulfatase n=1 Tax=Sphingobacterium TaxID=28453 RepID=UPI0013DAB676|nr:MULTISPECIES: arylsulfatase [unclassified Sphingobacterium]